MQLVIGFLLLLSRVCFLGLLIMTTDIMRLEDALDLVKSRCGETVWNKIREHMLNQAGTIDNLEREIEYMEQAGMRQRRKRRDDEWE